MYYSRISLGTTVVQSTAQNGSDQLTIFFHQSFLCRCFSVGGKSCN